KGLDVLLAAFRKLQEKWRDLRLTIVGEGDLRPYRSQIERATNVAVVNRWVDDREIPGMFRSAAIVVLPYVSASHSGVIALASDFGGAVVRTRVGAIPEQIRNRETGLLVEPGSVDGLASAIEELLINEDLRRRLACRLSSEAKSGLNWDIVSDAYLDSCNKAV